MDFTFSVSSLRQLLKCSNPAWGPTKWITLSLIVPLGDGQVFQSVFHLTWTMIKARLLQAPKERHGAESAPECGIGPAITGGQIHCYCVHKLWRALLSNQKQLAKADGARKYLQTSDSDCIGAKFCRQRFLAK